MNGITPLQYSNAPIQMMSALASDIQQQNILNQKRYQEEFNQGLELARMISPEVLNKSFDAQVVNAGIADVKNNLREYIKKNPNANSAQIQSEVQKQLGGISDWSTKVKTIKSNLEETFKQIPQDKKVNKDRWMNAALTKALYKTNPDGTRTFRNAQELDPAFDYATEVWNMGGEAFVDLGGVSKELDDRIKNAAKNKQNVTVTVGATKNKPGFTRTDNIEVPVWAEWDATKNKVTVKKQNGVIDNDVYTAFVGGPNTEYDKFLNIKTRSAFASGENLGVDVTEVFDDKGNIKDQTKFDLAKRNWLTNYLEKFAPVTQTERDVTQPARTQVVITRDQPKDETFIDVVSEVKDYMTANPRKKGTNWYPVTAFGDVAQDAIIGKARKVTGINSIGLKDIQIEDRGGKPSIIIAQDILDDRGEVAYKKGQYLSSLGTQANISANQPLGAKAKGAAVQAAQTKKKYNPQTGKYE
jgi:hypothetical protein